MKLALRVAGVFFLILGIVHGLRIAFKVTVVAGNYTLPIGLSIAGAIVTLMLAGWMFKAAK